jgi:hypothetical protein
MKWRGIAKERKGEEAMTRREREKFFSFSFLFRFTRAKVRPERQSEKASKRIDGIDEYEFC